jgi:hypothetical protein
VTRGLPSLAVALLALIAAGCPRMGPDPFAEPSPFVPGMERMVSADLSMPAAAPAVAWDGEDFLVVWSARRGAATDLFGARIAPDGTPVDRSPRVISSSPGNQHHPSVAWGREEFLVVWEDDRSGVNRIYGTHVTPRGEVVEPNGFAIAGSRYEQSAPVAVWTGSGFCVVWTESLGGGNGLDLYGAILDSSIDSTATGGLPLVVGPGDQFQSALAWGSDSGLLVWSDDRSSGTDASLTDLYAARLAPDGRRLGADTLLVTGAAGAQTFPSVAWDGTQFDLVWLDHREGPGLIYGTAISAKGALRDPGGLQITQGPAENGPPVLTILENYLADRSQQQQPVGLWTDNSQGQFLAVGRIWPNGFEPMPSLTGPVTYLQVDGVPRLRAAATDRGELLVVWEGLPAGGGSDTQIFSRQIAVKQ